MMRWAGLLLALAGCSVSASPPASGPAQAAPKDPILEIYAVAARYYETGDYEASLAVCEHLLRMDPYFGPAVAMRDEVNYIRGTHRLTLGLLARTRLDKVEYAIEEGRNLLFAGNLVLAEKCAQLALDLAPLLPPEMDIELRMVQAQAILDWAKAFREEEER